MFQTLRANTIQRNMYVHNITDPKSINYTYGKENEILVEKGHSYCTSCINCKNPYCMYLDSKDINIKEFKEIQNTTHMLICPNEAISCSTDSISIDEEKCIGCGLCAASCPMGAIYIENGKAKVSVNDSVRKMVKSEKQQNIFLDNYFLTMKNGIIIYESDLIYEKLYKQIENLSQEKQNILARNLLIKLGSNAAIARKGNVYLRLDGFYSNSKELGPVEIETGHEMLDVSRSLLDDIAVVNVRYHISQEKQHPLAICLSFPNKRTDYWQVIKDIKNVTGITINTISFGALMILVWNFSKIKEFNRFYIDNDNMSIRNEISKILGRNINVSNGSLGIFENGK